MISIKVEEVEGEWGFEQADSWINFLYFVLKTSPSKEEEGDLGEDYRELELILKKDGAHL